MSDRAADAATHHVADSGGRGRAGGAGDLDDELRRRSDELLAETDELGAREHRVLEQPPGSAALVDATHDVVEQSVVVDSIARAADRLARDAAERRARDAGD
jgi:hypothetical protein